MKKTLGFDLGTTYSAVSIPEKRTGAGFLTVPECPGVSLILDDKGKVLIPSVVGENARGELVVGARAKNLAGLNPGPVTFSKRWMGEDKSFPMKTLDPIRPVDAATHVLGYLKKMAEKRLGYEITDAVITVPAYFSLNAKQLTEIAGARAGLNVAQIIQEPVAAAQVYLANDPRERITVMTYDLGGGTFDVSIVKKQDGFMDNIAFAGDSALGGYNFDNALLSWMRNQIRENYSGCEIDMSDGALVSKLMDAAERCKISLSQEQTAQISGVGIGVKDEKGELLKWDLMITRDEFEEMILPDLEKTISECEEARKRAGIDESDIDEILLIGGSSKIPLVRELLEKAYSKKPLSIQPDLCVALGAGITAGNLGTAQGCVHLDFIPPESDLGDLDVTGRLMTDENFTSTIGAAVTLNTIDGIALGTTNVVAETGGFSFLDIPLEEGVENEFVLVVNDSEGIQVGEALQFSIWQRERADGSCGLSTPPANVLSKPISIMTSEGVRDVIDRNSPLPTSVSIQAVTTDTSGKVTVPIFEDNTEIGRVEIVGLEKTIPVGTQVNIEVEVDLNYLVNAEAHIPSANREAKVNLTISERVLKSASELRRDFVQVNARAEEALTGGGTEALFAAGKAVKVKEVQREAARLVDNDNPDSVAVQNCLEKLEALVEEMDNRWKPNPPRGLFDSLLMEIEEELEDLLKAKAEIAKDGYGEKLIAIRDAAEKAFKNQSGVRWSEEFGRLKQLQAQIEKLAYKDREGRSKNEQPVDYSLLILSLGKDLKNLKDQALHLPFYNDDWKSEFESAEKELASIDPDESDVGSRILEFHRTRLLDFEERLNRAITESGEDGVIKIDTILS